MEVGNGNDTVLESVLSGQCMNRPDTNQKCLKLPLPWRSDNRTVGPAPLMPSQPSDTTLSHFHVPPILIHSCTDSLVASMYVSWNFFLGLRCRLICTIYSLKLHDFICNAVAFVLYCCIKYVFPSKVNVFPMLKLH
jgi:hypothetical protein